MDAQKSIAIAKAEIINEIQQGFTPITVKSFSDLHDYADANEYGGICDDELFGRDKFNTFEEWIAFSDEVQNAIDAWIKSGEMVKAVGIQSVIDFLKSEEQDELADIVTKQFANA